MAANFKRYSWTKQASKRHALSDDTVSQLLRITAIEILLLQQSAADVLDVCNSRRSTQAEELLGLADTAVLHPSEGGQSATLGFNSQEDVEAMLDHIAGKTAAEATEVVGRAVGKPQDDSWLSVRLSDPEVKFAVR